MMILIKTQTLNLSNRSTYISFSLPPHRGRRFSTLPPPILSISIRNTNKIGKPSAVEGHTHLHNNISSMKGHRKDDV